jgi:hypothetical protein
MLFVHYSLADSDEIIMWVDENHITAIGVNPQISKSMVTMFQD